MNTQALKHLGITKNTNDCGCNEGSARQKVLVSVAAAFAVNCTSNLEKHIELARNVGISDNEIKSILEITLAIKFKAASHVDRIAEKIGTSISSENNNSALDETTCGCSGDC